MRSTCLHSAAGAHERLLPRCRTWVCAGARSLLGMIAHLCYCYTIGSAALGDDDGAARDLRSCIELAVDDAAKVSKQCTAAQ